MARLNRAAPGGTPPPATRLRQVRLRTARLLRLEAAWPRLLPAITLLLLAALLALLGLPQRLPLWLHGILVLLLVGWCGWCGWRAVEAAPRPSQARIDRRIEQRSGLVHRPLHALADTLAATQSEGDGTGSQLWQAHRQRAGASLIGLRAGAPSLPAWRHPAGRLGLALLPAVLLAALLAGPQALPRLASGLMPGLFEPPGPRPWMQAWVTPPDYTGAAPVFLTDPHAAVTVPAGSILQVNLTGLQGRPRVAAIAAESAPPPRTAAVASRQDVHRLGAGSWSLTRRLDASVRIRLSGNGRSVAAWTLNVTPLPPSLVAWDGAPGASSSRTLEPWRTRLPWRFSNPYGLRRLSAELGLAGQPPSPGGLPPLDVEIPVEPEARRGHGVALPDLSADPRAGEVLTGRLAAVDEAGRRSLSAEVRFRLPARPFRNPIARAVLDVRRRVALGREGREDGASDLDAIGSAPGELAADSGLFLNLTATAALLRDHDVEDETAVREATVRLWELALALEDGLHNDRESARAAAGLRAARDALASQLERMRELGARGQTTHEQAELERRIQALQQALARRLQTLVQEARRNHTILPALPGQQQLTGGDLDRMMQTMREEAAHGRADQAMHRLAQMQAMLDHMRAATPRDLQSAAAQAQARQQAQEQMDALKDLVQRQSGLLDHSQARVSAHDRLMRQQGLGAIDPQTAELLRRLGIPSGGTQPDTEPQADGAPPLAVPPANPDQPGGAAPDQAARAADAQRGQEAHRQHVLGRAVEELAAEFKGLVGTAPDGLGRARQDMEAARRALAAGRDPEAQQAQQQALADLQKGNQQMQQAMRASGAGSSLVMMPGLGGEGGNDPGRPGEEDVQGDDQDSGPSGPRDPFGRPTSGSARADESDTHIPDKAEQMRAREIEQELRRRDSDRTRPPAELDYLDRLLKPF